MFYNVSKIFDAMSHMMGSLALLVAEDNPAGLDFVRLDQRLALAAEREGLRVVW